MLELAEFLTTTPSGVTQDWMDELRSVGWEDVDVIEIVHVVALFNYMCRIADGLGVDLETDRGWEDQSDKLSFKDDTAPKAFGKIAPTPKAPVA